MWLQAQSAFPDHHGPRNAYHERHGCLQKYLADVGQSKLTRADEHRGPHLFHELEDDGRLLRHRNEGRLLQANDGQPPEPADELVL